MGSTLYDVHMRCSFVAILFPSNEHYSSCHNHYHDGGNYNDHNSSWHTDGYDNCMSTSCIHVLTHYKMMYILTIKV